MNTREALMCDMLERAESNLAEARRHIARGDREAARAAVLAADLELECLDIERDTRGATGHD